MKITGSAGHSLHTSGKRCPDDSMREFMFNVAVFNYFKAEIEQYKDKQGNKVTVIPIHDTSGQKDISLAERTRIVNSHAPDVHIDFHANAHGNGLVWTDANGIETFVYNLQDAASKRLADAVQSNLIAATGLRNRGVKQGDLHMLRTTTRAKAKILIEGPFMTNKKEAELLKSDAFRRKFANVVVKGVIAVYQLTPIAKPKNGWLKENNIWYFYDNGTKKTGWVIDNGKWYYLESSGAMKTGWAKVNGKWYYLNPKVGGPQGSMMTGVIEDKGKLYFLNNDGAMAENTSVTVNLKAGKDGALTI